MCFFKKKPDPFIPTSTKEIFNSDLWGDLRQYCPNATIYLSDKVYKLCSWDDIALFLAQDKSNKYEYQAEFYDCDDFSYRLMGQFSIPGWAGLTLGIIWTSWHALNCFVDEDEKLWLIEPQTDEISDDIPTDVRLIVM